MPKVSPDLTHLDVHLGLEHDQARKNRRSPPTVPDRQGSSTSTAWAPAKGEYEESMTGSSLKSTSGYSSVTTSPSYDETRSSREGGERRQSSLGHLVEKAKAKLNRQPTGSETVVR
ncbi:hypothetical protein LTR91_007332 [Friedmanniomyces endolithicus]|uniref:Uncharacterized protein n=1 Tax=Friedmanniomyces endolithicus TaxID=329885 RepID=A0AAN6KQH9_9PEZI|nr:hypothetical protein LTR57_012527 [Friedmanniomyces endolithicus]KAK0991285.1 hypothetical protein LTS01_008200 [Friedmanniomyces endolithicus]KAK0995433.1 hypothetical protein LTR91_007332 [Friedmanniomyces endolithicus]KAK1046697.1 hypothetical protein LTS16_005727 [Friedmanniomyces endolithicus]